MLRANRETERCIGDCCLLRASVEMKTSPNKDFAYAMVPLKIFAWPVGTWPLQKVNVSSNFRSVVSVCFLMVMVTIIQTEVYLDPTDAEKTLDGVMMAVCSITAVSKVTWFRIRSNGLTVNFVSALKDYNELDGEEKRAIMRRHAYMGRLTCASVLGFSFVASTLSLTIPVLFEDEDVAAKHANVTEESLEYPIPSKNTMEMLQMPKYLNPVIFLIEYVMLLITCAGNVGNIPCTEITYTSGFSNANSGSSEFITWKSGGECSRRWFVEIPGYRHPFEVTNYALFTINVIKLNFVQFVRRNSELPKKALGSTSLVFRTIDKSSHVSGSDSLFFGITIHLCGQAELLKLELAKFINGSENLIGRFNELISRHRHLLKLSKKLNYTISFILAVQLFTSCLLICTTGFQLIVSLYVHNIPMLIKTFIVESTLLMQLFAYSFVGEYLKNQMEDIGYSIYCSDWYNIPTSLSRDFVFVLMRAQTPVYMRAGHHFVVNMVTYMSIVRVSMSYLSVLRVMITT